MSPKIQLPSAKTIVSAAASVAATAMVVRSIARDFIPPDLHHFILSKFHLLLTAFTNDVTLAIDEFDGLNRNQLFSAAELYISTVAGPSAKRLRVSLPEKEKQIHVSLEGNEEISDLFRGSHLKWRLSVSKIQTRSVTYAGEDDGCGTTVETEVRYLELTFHKKHKSMVIDEYLPYVLKRSKAVKEENKTVKLHMLRDEFEQLPGRSPWTSVNLDHPANFETLAMDGEMKSAIMDDLDRFLNRRELYRKVGKAWKRGYLLYGPPGTGKSSLVAAMANYLRFDVYDLELTSVWSNSALRRLILSTANRSIVVVEDIDSTIDLTTRKGAPPPAMMYSDNRPKVTLSGLLNYIDGLWSSCGDERIIIFTTNHKDELDPALLRPGRMDLHINMSYCTPCGFKLLVTNYLGAITENDPLVTVAERLIASTEVTPAEVGEYLLKSDDPETALKGLIEFLDPKKETKRKNGAAIGLKSGGTNRLDRLKGPITEIIPLVNEAERLIASTKVTPAEVGEYLLKSGDPETALKSLTENLDPKKESERENGAAIGLKSGGTNGLDQLKGLVEKATSAEMSEKIIKKDEAANALEVLIGILETETGVGKTNESVSSSVANGKENGINSVKMVGSV